MEALSYSESEFESCQYSNRLLNLLEKLNKIVDNPINIFEIKKAIYYARKYHENQLRKSGEPYYSHPVEVAYLFAKYVGCKCEKYYTTHLIIAGILHDTIEDTKLTKNMISKIFNHEIACYVEDLTRIKNGVKISPKEALDILYFEKKEEMLYIKMFDRLHNLKTIHVMPPMKQEKIMYETKEYFIPYATKLGLYDLSNELIWYSFLPIVKNIYKNNQNLPLFF